MCPICIGFPIFGAEKSITIFLFLFFVFSGYSQESEDIQTPSNFVFIIGPRIGGSYTFMEKKAYNDYIHQAFPIGDYNQFNTIFGIRNNYS